MLPKWLLNAIPIMSLFAFARATAAEPQDLVNPEDLYPRGERYEATVPDTLDLAWHADQYAQETIGVDLAAAGWEAIGAGDLPTPEPNAPVRSATYAVRRLS